MPYYEFTDDDGNESGGSFEAFYADEWDADDLNELLGDVFDEDTKMESGWYWWACFEGCLPDSGPSGPFVTEDDAVNDARG